MKKKQKLKKYLPLAALVLVALGILSFIGLELYRVMTPDYVTETAETYVADDSVGVSGFFVRSETVLPELDGLKVLHFREGEKVGKGQAVATVYRNEESLALQQELNDLSIREEQLLYALSVGEGNTGTALRLDGEILDKLKTLRSYLAADNISARSDTVIESLRTLVLQREFRADGDTEEALQAVESRLQQLRSQVSGASQSILAPVSGIYSAVVDGYESILTPDTMVELTPSLIGHVEPGSEASETGKLISSSTWYYAAAMPKEAASRLRKNNAVTLRFIGRATEDVRCSVYELGKTDGDSQVVIFSSNRQLANFSVDRSLSCEVIFKSYEGLRVSKKALRVNEEGQSGVYCMVGLTARFKPVSIVYSSGDYAIVTADDPSRETLRLREGDTVIISAGELYDGMVMN